MNDQKKVSIIVFSGDLDKLLAAFFIATGAAAAGQQVTMFFTFWGLKLIQQTTVKPRGLNWLKKLFGLMLKPGPDRRALSKMNFLGAGPVLLKQLMRQSKIPSLAELMQTAKSLGVKFVACSTSMEIMGVTRQSLIPEVEQVAGVTTFLVEAQVSSLNLFI
ncbi:DsrE/DsrF/DrsH-like family protein [candidate division KSB1 bacterium]|nr:DsrE/DsrF/DrsH-like family protein [candidate division KSB1 bacterium]